MPSEEGFARARCPKCRTRLYVDTAGRLYDLHNDGWEEHSCDREGDVRERLWCRVCGEWFEGDEVEKHQPRSDDRYVAEDELRAALAALDTPQEPPEPGAEGWQQEIRYRREFECACGYIGWEYRNDGYDNALICTKCGNGRRAHPPTDTED